MGKNKKAEIVLYFRTDGNLQVRKLIPEKHPSVISFIGERIEKIAELHRIWDESKRAYARRPTLYLTAESFERMQGTLGVKCQELNISVGTSAFYVVIRKQ